MLYLGETISLVVAFSWTITALCSEVASKRLGALQLNVIRMLLSLCLLSGTLWIFTGSPFPVFANTQAWIWLLMSGLVGYVFGDYCLFNSYVLIGSRFGQLFMTLAPPTAAFASWMLLSEQLPLQAWVGMVVTLLGISMSVLNKGKQDSHHRLELKLPLKGVLFGVGAGVGQGLGLVLSKVGMNYYEAGVPEGMNAVNNLLPFVALKYPICIITESVSITKSPPTIGKTSSCLTQIAAVASTPPKNKELVSPIKTCAG